MQDLSFRVREGELFAFLGLNGAGKSTTISILCGQLAKDAGSIVVDGADLDHDADKIKRELGVVFQASVLGQGVERPGQSRVPRGDVRHYGRGVPEAPCGACVYAGI